MAETRCPTCDHPLTEGASRCAGCGRVLGEANRCPRCGNVAGVRRSGAGFACAACGGAREPGPDTVVIEETAYGGEAGTALARGGAVGLRLAGVGLVAGGILAAALALAVLPGTAGYVVALLAAALFVGLGAGALKLGSRASESVGSRVTSEREQRILELAEQHGGSLTATDAARGLGLGLEEADRALTAMADGSRVTVEVSPEGIVRYVFRELEPGGAPGPRVRVADDEMAARGEDEEGRGSAETERGGRADEEGR